MEKRLNEILTGPLYDWEVDCQPETIAQMTEHLIENGVTVPVRCRHCKFHHWEQEPCHGKTEHFCSVLNVQVFADFYCYHGKPKEREG